MAAFMHDAEGCVGDTGLLDGRNGGAGTEEEGSGWHGTVMSGIKLSSMDSVWVPSPLWRWLAVDWNFCARMGEVMDAEGLMQRMAVAAQAIVPTAPSYSMACRTMRPEA